MLELSHDKLEKRKDAHPYDWVYSYEKFNYPSSPDKKHVYSSLRDAKSDKSDGYISDEQYQHLENVWDTFNFDKFEDFHNCYLKKDVLLLADVFEKFISCLKYHNLDPCHYFSAPSLSWDVMLKMIKIELEKISDPDKYIFIEKRMRGGIGYINKRYSKANNEYCSDYDSENLKTCITYFDINNLYGHAVSQYLPYANFKWVKNADEIEQNLTKIKSNSSTGYILELDLEYPKNLYCEHNDYPLAQEKINIQKEWLSDYCLKIANEHNINIGTVKNLVPNKMNKRNYVIHYRNLQQCVQKGLKLEKYIEC